MNLTTLFSGQKQRPLTPITESVINGPAERRTAATISAELETLRDAAVTLTGKLREAQGDLCEAQAGYDAGIGRFALGEGREPDRGVLQASITRLDALQRVGRDQQTSIAVLMQELTGAQLMETLATSAAELPVLIQNAGMKLEAFAKAVAAAKHTEADLFIALFDERTGLKKVFGSPDLDKSAAGERAAFRRKVEEISNRSAYRVSSRFETDGEVNVGAEWSFDNRIREGAFYERHGNQPRIDPRDRGFIVPELEVKR